MGWASHEVTEPHDEVPSRVIDEFAASLRLEHEDKS